jgi:chromosome segregation ATPase
MEISEIKKKILERLEDENARASLKKTFDLATLSAKVSSSDDGLSREKPTVEHKLKLGTLESENERLKKIQEDARSKSDVLLRQIADKDRAIADLQKKLASESIGIIKDSEKEKSLINTAIEKSIAEYRTKLVSLEKENEKLKNTHALELRQNEDVFLQIAEKDKEIAELKKKFHHDSGEKEKLPGLESENKKLKKLHEDALRQNDNLLIRIDQKDKEIAELEKKVGSEPRVGTASLVEENKRLKKLHEDALKQNEGYLAQMREREKSVSEIERRVQEESGSLKTEKERAVANMEGLRSKLYASTKELKELTARISQLEEILKNREKRLAESDKVYRNLEKEKQELAAKLESVEATAKSFEDRLKGMADEVEAKEKRAQDAERLCNKTIDSAKKEMDLQIQAVERSRKALEGKIAQLNIELTAKDKRVEETELANKELDNLVRESALKLQAAENAKGDLEDKVKHIEGELDSTRHSNESDKASYEEKAAALNGEIETLKTTVKDKEKIEEELRDNILHLESEIESRDKKIQTDIRYCEGVVREVNDLRQKIKAYRLKVK